MALKEIKYTAIIIESERGWGQRIDETKEFDTAEERDKFIKEYNSKNTDAVVPDWYMKAEKGPDKINEPPTLQWHDEE